MIKRCLVKHVHILMECGRIKRKLRRGMPDWVVHVEESGGACSFLVGSTTDAVGARALHHCSRAGNCYC